MAKTYLAKKTDVDSLSSRVTIMEKSVSPTIYKNSSFVVNGGYEYELELSGNITVTVPDTVAETFVVADASNSFSVTHTCTIDFSANGQGTLTLNTARDMYKFYWVETQSKWYYKNMLNGDGGQVN